ncbi:hypothetical protein ACFSUK_31720 [Sphingobium scionense]
MANGHIVDDLVQDVMLRMHVRDSPMASTIWMAISSAPHRASCAIRRGAIRFAMPRAMTN